MRGFAHLGLAFAIMLSGTAGVAAQTGKPAADVPKYDLKPLVPPVIALPRNSTLSPGSSSTRPGDPPSGSNVYSNEPVSAPGLTITIPTR